MTPGAARSRAAARSLRSALWAAVVLVGTLVTAAPAVAAPGQVGSAGGAPAVVAAGPVPPAGGGAARGYDLAPARGAERSLLRGPEQRSSAGDRSGSGTARRPTADDRSRAEQVAPTVPPVATVVAGAGAGGGSAGPVPTADLPRTPPAVAPPAGPGPPATTPAPGPTGPATPGAPRAPPSAA